MLLRAEGLYESGHKGSGLIEEDAMAGAFDEQRALFAEDIADRFEMRRIEEAIFIAIDAGDRQLLGELLHQTCVIDRVVLDRPV